MRERGFTLVEVLLAVAIIVIALLALLSMLSAGSVNVHAGGGQSKATAYARQQVELLRNVPVTAPAFVNGADTPEPGVARAWTVAQVGATGAPNRLWRIVVTAGVNNSRLIGSETITLETMRAE